MPYASLDDLIARAGAAEIGQVADRDGDGVPDPDVIAAAIEAAGETIDAYLATRFTLPFDPVPSIVRKWAVSIARYQLHRDAPPDYVVRDQKDAMGELRDAAANRLALPGASGLQPAQSPAGQAIAEGSPSVFGGDALDGFL